jgi:hypothetical protein
MCTTAELLLGYCSPDGSFPQTRANSIYTTDCPNSSQGSVTRTCSPDAVWSDPIEACFSTSATDLTLSPQALKELSENPELFVSLMNTVIGVAGADAGNGSMSGNRGNGTDAAYSTARLESHMRLFCELMQHSPFSQGSRNIPKDEMMVMANVS